MLPRILEPEVMDTASEAEDYNAMDHSAVNRAFVDDFLAALATIAPVASRPWKIFDAGTGTALIPLELVHRGVRVEITAADLAEEMLAVARRNFAAALREPGAQARMGESTFLAGVSGSLLDDSSRVIHRPPHPILLPHGGEGTGAAIRLIRADCKDLDFPDATFDAVISNSIIHHIPEPISVLRECWRILRPGGLLFVRDLMRPSDLAELDHLVETYAASANAHGRQMFRDSLHAALTIVEVGEMLDQIGILADRVVPTSDRHWTVTAVKI